MPLIVDFVPVNPMILSPFDRCAENYDRYALAQLAVSTDLAKLLPQEANYVLEIGSGTGALSRYLLGHYPESRFVFVDHSLPMMNQLGSRFTDEHKVERICQDFCTANLEEGFDLIATSSALHWLTPLDYALTSIRRYLAPQGTFVGSCAVAGTLDELYRLKCKISPRKQLEGRLPTIESVQRLLRESGFTVVQERVHEFKIRFPSGRHLFQHLRGSGVNGAPLVAARLSRTELGTLLRATESGLEVTYRSYLFRAE